MVCAGESLPLSSCWGLGWSGGSHRGRWDGRRGQWEPEPEVREELEVTQEPEVRGEEGSVPGEGAVETRSLTGELGVSGWKQRGL